MTPNTNHEPQLPTTASAAVIGPPPEPGVEGNEARSCQNTKVTRKLAETTTYGSFWIHETEFAIPVGVIREVVNEPDRVTEVPMSPPYMIGVFNLRNVIVPVVDLQILLEFPKSDQTGTRKIAIIEHGELCIGLMFDATGEILNDMGASRVEFGAEQNGIKDILIDGILKLDNGERTVQILDPHELLRIEKVPRISSAAETDEDQNDLGKRDSCISFQVAHTTCGIDLRYVREVTEMPKVEKSFLSHHHILGTANLRGTTLPIIDFRKFLGDEPVMTLTKEMLSNRRLLIMDTRNGPVGLVVYSIDSIIPYFQKDLRPFTKIALPRGDIVRGCLLKIEHDIVIMLDHDKLMNDDELLRVAGACQEIHPRAVSETPEKAKTKSLDSVAQRRTFILFTILNRFAMCSTDVCEVINPPDNLLVPPYALKFVEGIIDLRGELIMLINPRVLYGFPEIETSDRKILIFKTGGQKYGLMVDSIDEIAMTTNNHVIQIPSVSAAQDFRNVSDDLAGCLDRNWQGPDGSPVGILNVSAVVERCLDLRDASDKAAEARVINPENNVFAEL